jgi:hypothetical protein
MPIPILAAVGAKVALPIVGKLLGGTALKGLLGGLMKGGIGQLLGMVTKFMPMANNILGALGDLGLSGMKPPMPQGGIPNFGYPPPRQERPGGQFGAMPLPPPGLGKFFSQLMGALGPQGQPQLQEQMGAVKDMFNLLQNIQQQMQDVMHRHISSLRA